MLKDYFSGEKPFKDCFASLNNIKKTPFFTLLVILMFFGNINAQTTANYSVFTGTAGSFALDRNSSAVDMTTGTTQIVASDLDDNNGSGLISNIGFDFFLYGNRYTQFSASSNGLIGLGSTVISPSAYTASGGSIATPRISAFCADLRTGASGKVHYKVIGAAPNRCLVIEFLNMSLLYAVSPGSNDGTFQVRLYETSGVVELMYGAMSRNAGTIASTSAVSIGLSVGTAAGTTISMTSSANSFSTAAAFNTNTYAAGSGAIPNLNSTTATARRTYTFIPPGNPSHLVTNSISSPTALTFTSISTTGMTLNWGASSPTTGVLKYAIYNSTDNINFSYVNSTLLGTNTYVATGLSAGTTYYWKVYPLSEGRLGTALTGSQITDVIVACTTPTAQPTSLNLTAVTNTTLSGAFTAASPVPSGYLVVRSTSSTLSSNPVDGTSYTAGNALGGGTVVQSGTAITFSQTGLTANTRYYYFVFSFNNTSCSGGPKYFTTAPLTANTYTCLTAPTSSAGTSVTNGGFTANWATVSGATGYLLDVSTVNTFASFVTGYNGLVVSGGSTVSQAVTGLSASTNYYYRVRATNATSCTSASSATQTVYTGHCTPTATSGTNAYITNFSTTLGISNISNTSVFTANAYQDNYATTAVSMYATGTINYSFTLATTSLKAAVAIWVDWNNNLVFETSERVYLSPGYIDSGTYTGIITVPGGTALGNYRLRIKSDYSSTSPDPCVTSVGTNAETEDYKFTVITIPTDAVDYANIQSPGVSTTTTGTPVDIYGQAYEPDVTDPAGAATALQVWYSTNAADVDPSSAGWTGTWTAAAFNTNVGNNDEWKGTINPIIGQADTYYSFRYQLNGGPYRYGGYPSGFWNGTSQKNGKLSVNYEVYTNSTPKTINDVITINFKDFDASNIFYTGTETTIYAYAGIRIVSGTDFNYAQGNINTLSSLIPFTLSGGIYSSTIKLADYFCIPAGVNVDGVNMIFRNQYFTGGNCDGTVGNNDKTCNLYLDLTNAAVAVNPPTAVANNTVTLTSANVTFTAPLKGTNKGYEYYVSTSATTPGAGVTPVVAAATSPIAISGLSNATTYYIYVRTAGCGSDRSAWSAYTSFTTLSPPPANDACSNATALPCATVALAGTTVGSVSEVLSVTAWNASTYGVWYTFVGDGTLNLISTTAGSGFDHKLSIASGSCGTLTNVTTVDLASAGGTETYSFTPALGTVYYVYISYYGSAGLASDTGTFTISRTCNIPVVYCTPSSSTGSASNNYITKVSFLGTLNDTSNTSTYSSTSAGYGDFTGLASHASQIQGEAINISVEINVNSTLRAWIDWNKDGDFTDSGETIFDSDLASALLSSATFGFVVPNVTPGDYRVRIRARGNATFDSCSNYNSSDTEDYIFTVIGRCAAEIFTVTDAERCGPGTVNLAATGTSGVQFKWYTALTGGSLLATTPTGSYSPTVASTTSFYVTAYNGTCETQIRKEVVARVKELADIVLPTSLESCGDKNPIVLTATAGNETVYLLSENFESGLGTMSSVQNGATDNIAKWRLKTGPYKPSDAAGTWLPVISTGFGANSFATATSDMGIVNYSLDNSIQNTSAVNTTGFTNLTLKFRVYFSRFYTDNTEVASQDEYVNVEVSTNGGLTWIATPIAHYVTDLGNPGKLAEISLNLNTYINQANLKFRIRYKTQKWTHGVAIDDIQLYGQKTLVPSFTWSGAGLNVFQDAALTIPYTSGTPASTVYAVPDISTLGNTSFDINVSTTVTNGCTVTKTINVTNKSKVWNGSSSADWNNPNNWSPSGVPNNTACIIIPNTTVKPIVSGSANGKNISIKPLGELLVNSNNTLTINDAVDVKSTGKLTFENNASLVQINESPSINSGNIIYKRNTSNMLRYSYTYWASPVYALTQTLSTLSPATLHDKYYSWDGTGQSWTLHDNGTVAMEKAKGYIVRAPQTFPVTGTAASYNATFDGVPNNGLITIATQGSTTADKFNLIGNPYPSALDANLFLANSINPGLEGTIYLWTNFSGISSVPNAGGTYSYTNSDYATYNFSGGTATAPATGSSVQPTGYVGAGQSFFVKGISNGSGTATFNNTMRIGANNNQFFRNTEIERHRFWLNLENSQGGFNQALVAYVQGATNYYDRGYDGELFGGNTATFYSIIPDRALTIQGKSLPFDLNDVVPMGYKTTVAGNYKITLDHFDGLFDAQVIYLKDKLLNTIHDIKNSPYNFISAIGTFDNRFEIVYKQETLGINNPKFDSNSVVIYKKDKEVFINAGLTSISQLKVFDIQGRMIYENKNINKSDAVIKNLPPAEQVLIVQVILLDGNTVSKKVVY